MSLSIRRNNDVVTLTIDGEVDPVTIYKDCQECFNSFVQGARRAVVVLDMTSANNLGPLTESLLNRSLQHPVVSRIGIFGVNPAYSATIERWAMNFQGSSPVIVSRTEAELRTSLGLKRQNFERGLG